MHNDRTTMGEVVVEDGPLASRRASRLGIAVTATWTARRQLVCAGLAVGSPRGTLLEGCEIEAAACRAAIASLPPAWAHSP